VEKGLETEGDVEICKEKYKERVGPKPSPLASQNGSGSWVPSR